MELERLAANDPQLTPARLGGSATAVGMCELANALRLNTALTCLHLERLHGDDAGSRELT
jgi:hypothetical protein